MEGSQDFLVLSMVPPFSVWGEWGWVGEKSSVECSFFTASGTALLLALPTTWGKAGGVARISAAQKEADGLFRTTMARVMALNFQSAGWMVHDVRWAEGGDK